VTPGPRSIHPLGFIKERCGSLWRSLDPVLAGSIVLSAGTILGGGTVVLLSPIITRLYGPATFGMLAVYVSLLTLAAPFASMRYEMAIPIEKNDAAAANLLLISLALAVLTTAVAAVAVTWHLDLILRIVKEPSLGRYLPFLPIAFCFAAVYQVLSSWAVRNQAFLQIARTRASQSLGSVGTKLAVGLVNGSPWGLFAGDLIGRASGTGVLLTHLIRTWPSGAISLRTAAAAMRRYVKFPLLTTWASVLTTAGSQLPILILSRHFGMAVAGWYALTSSVLGTPSSLVGQALGQAFLGRAAHLQNRKDELRALTESTLGWIFVIGLPVFTFVGLEGPRLFTAVFGERWAVAGIYAQRLAPLAFIWLVASPLNHLLTIREWQEIPAAFCVVQCIFTISALYAGIWLKSPEAGITILGIGMFLLTSVVMEVALRAGYTSWGRLLRRLLPLAGCALLAIAPASAILRSPTLPVLVAQFVASLIIYFFLVRVWRLYPSASWNAAAPRTAH